MPDFADPFAGAVPKKMTESELVRAILLDIAAELEAVHLYLAHVDATDNEDAKKVLYDVALEEYVHAGEFTSLLYRIDPVAGQKAQEGFDEVQQLLGSKAPLTVEPSGRQPIGKESEPEPQPSAPHGLTVGNLAGEGSTIC